MRASIIVLYALGFSVWGCDADEFTPRTAQLFDPGELSAARTGTKVPPPQVTQRFQLVRPRRLYTGQEHPDLWRLVLCLYRCV